MENDPNPMPEIHLFDNFKDVAIAIGSSALSYLSILPSKPLSCVSEHFQRDNKDTDLSSREDQLPGIVWKDYEV